MLILPILICWDLNQKKEKGRNYLFHSPTTMNIVPETATDTNNSANRNRYNSENRNRAYVWKPQTAFETALKDGQNRKPHLKPHLRGPKTAYRKTLHPP